MMSKDGFVLKDKNGDRIIPIKDESIQPFITHLLTLYSTYLLKYMSTANNHWDKL